MTKVMMRLDKDKCDKDYFDEFKSNMQARMNFIESTFDALNDKTKSLENWIDVYMPLRI